MLSRSVVLPVSLTLKASLFQHCDNALLLYLALKQARAPPSELHLYSQGGHGFGLCSHREDVCSWPRRAQQYLELRGLVAGDPRLDPPNPPPQKLDDEASAAVDNRDLAAGSLIHTWDYSDQPCKGSSSLCSAASAQRKA